MDISPEVVEAQKKNLPVVALESTIICYSKALEEFNLFGRYGISTE